MTDPTDPLITRHRPTTFDDVVGNRGAIAALERRIKDPGRPHAYLFTGPAGIGKTTLARIIGGRLGATIEEADAASATGIDAMRALLDQAQYVPLGAANKLIILDECHRLSRQAWDAALKTLEEPPEHLYIALCTTELSKVPDTITSRCYHVRLDPLPEQEIVGFVIDILEKEGWDSIIQDDVFALVTQEAGGSPRQALKHLQAVYDAPSRAEAERIIHLQSSAAPLIQVLSILISRQGGWDAIRPMLAQLSADDFTEGTLLQASRYIIGALSRETDQAKAQKLWELLACMVYPAHSFDPRAILYAAIGRFLWSEP